MYLHINKQFLHEGIKEAMIHLNYFGKEVVGENQDRIEKFKELSVMIDIEDISQPTILKAMPSDLYTLVAYDLELNNGVLDWEGFDYTYHELYNVYYNDCVAELKRNNRTRRATLPIAGAKSYNSPHPPCMQVILFKIDNGKLHTTSVFRSNDGVKAIVMNLFGIARLAHRVARDVGVEVGGLTHIADSYHAYEKDWAELDGYCKMFDVRDDENLYYTYDEYLEVYDEYADEFIEECAKRRLEKEKKC